MTKKYYLSAVLIAKNEGAYLKEWLDFHLLVGVEHFYIYNNNSTDHTLIVLQPYIEAGLVTHILWDHTQLQAYLHAAKNFRHESRWAAFLDADEFLFGCETDDLKTILADYEEYAAVLAYWHCFGSSHLSAQPQGLVIKHYTWRAQDDFEANGHPKSIAQLDHIVSLKNSHVFYMNGVTVNERKEEINTLTPPLHEEKPRDILRINHYIVKSREDFERKVARGRASKPGAKFENPEGYWKFHNRNDVEDTRIWRFLEPLEAYAAKYPTPIALAGHFDGISRGRLVGWAVDKNCPSTAQVLDILCDNESVGQVQAKEPRNDLETQGLGKCGFAFPLPPQFFDGQQHQLDIRYAQTGKSIPNAPRMLMLEKASA